MQTSSDFQTGALVLLVATVVFGVFAALLLTPLLRQEDVSTAVVERPPTTEPPAEVPDRLAEFFPSDTLTAKSQLATVTAMSGHPPDMRLADSPRTMTRSASAISGSPLIYGSTEPPHSHRSDATRPRAANRGMSQLPHQSNDHHSQPSRVPIVSHHQSVAQLPSTLPSGTVYAPVTVNLDSSALSGQVQALEQRLTSLIDQAIPAEKPTGRRDDRRRSAKVARRETSVVQQQQQQQQQQQGESLREINSGLVRLSESLEHLEQRTSDRLTELARQAAVREANSQLHQQEWRSLLEARLRMAEAAQRTQLVLSETAATADGPRPIIAERNATANFDSDAGFATVPADRLEVPAPDCAEKTPAAKSVELFDELVPLPRERTIPEPADNRETPPKVAVPSDESTQMEPAASNSWPVMHFDDDRPPFPTVETPEATLPTQPTQREVVPTLQLEARPVIEPEALSESNATTSTSAINRMSYSTLRPVPMAAVSNDIEVARPPNARSRVGFEHVYRFQMDDVQADGVKPADDACPHCGKVHSTTCRHNTAEVATQARKVVSPVSTESARQVPYRHPSKKKSSPKRYIPGLKLPSLTASKNEPGILHRLGSTMRHLGRQTLK